MNVKKDKGSIAIFVLVALLFMSAFLIISFASNINKSKTVKEQFNIISRIYAYANGEEGAYDKAYSDLRNKNKQTMTASSENSSTLELIKTFNENISNYRIYGNSVQNGTPTPDNPVEVQSVGDLVTDATDVNYEKYKVSIKIKGEGKNLFNINNFESILKNSYSKSYKFKVENNIIYNGGVYGSSAGESILIRNNGANNYNISADVVGSEKFWVEILLFNEISDGYPVNYETNTYYYNLENQIDINIPVTTKYFSIAFFATAQHTIGLKNLQIESGTEKTEYEPYQGETFNIYLDEPLRKVGDVADYIDFKTGKVVRYVGKIDSYNGETITTSWISSTGELSTGATVYYVLNTPIEETVILPQLKSFEDYTKIEVLTSVVPSKIEVEYMGYTLE